MSSLFILISVLLFVCTMGLELPVIKEEDDVPNNVEANPIEDSIIEVPSSYEDRNGEDVEDMSNCQQERNPVFETNFLRATLSSITIKIKRDCDAKRIPYLQVRGGLLPGLKNEVIGFLKGPINAGEYTISFKRPVQCTQITLQSIGGKGPLVINGINFNKGGCVHNNKLYAVGERFSIDCNRCTCSHGGRIWCTKKLCGIRLVRYRPPPPAIPLTLKFHPPAPPPPPPPTPLPPLESVTLIAFGPYNFTNEDATGFWATSSKNSVLSTIKHWFPRLSIATNLYFYIQRDNSWSKSSITYWRFDTKKLETFHFDTAKTDSGHTHVTYNGYYLRCSSNSKAKDICNDLPIGKAVGAEVVSMLFTPRNGKAKNNEWSRNKYTLRGSYYQITHVLASQPLAPPPLPPPPVQIGLVYRFTSKNYPSRMMRHRGFEVWLDTSNIKAASYVKDSSFKIVSGLAGKGISFQSINYPDRYLRHRGGVCFIDKADGSELFRNDASFVPLSGLSLESYSVSFESVNFPGYFIRHSGFRVQMSKNDDSAIFGDDASWLPHLAIQQPAPTPTRVVRGNLGEIYHIAFGPFTFNDEDTRGVQEEFVTDTILDKIKRWTSRITIGTDLSFDVQRDNSRSKSTIKYWRFDTKKVETFSFNTGTTDPDHTQVTYDGHYLECSGNKNGQAMCNNLPIGRKVRAVVVSLLFNPRDGKVLNNEWWRNKYTLHGSYYDVSIEETQTTILPKPEPPVPKCKAAVNVGFIIDSSKSMKSYYQTEKNFVKTLVGAFGISKDGSRASVITFSRVARLSIKFNRYFIQNNFDKAVDNIPLMRSYTRIDRALELAKQMFIPAHGARVGKPNVLILLTDGTQTKTHGWKEPSSISAQLRTRGIHTIVVGMGTKVDKTELTNIAGSSTDTFTAETFSQLSSAKFATELLKKSCKSNRR